MQDDFTGATPRMGPTAGAPPHPASAPTPLPAFRIWVDDEARFDMRQACPLQTNFHRHPLMQLDALWQLSRKLMPLKKCRFLKPGATPRSAFNHFSKSQDGRDLEAVFRRIEEPGSWIALYNIENDPQYAGLVGEALATIRHLVDRQQAGMFFPQGFIFISAPPSVTPFHIDTENNFWLQIRGRKRMTVWDADDRAVVAGVDVEKVILEGVLDGVRLTDDTGPPSFERDCAAGDGVYFPSPSPHTTSSGTAWVRPGDGLAISLAIVFYTDHTRRHARIHAFNRLLRRVGVTPAFPGTSKLDDVKALLGRGLVDFKRKYRGYQAPPGF